MANDKVRDGTHGDVVPHGGAKDRTPARVREVTALVTSGLGEVDALGIVDSGQVDLIHDAIKVVEVVHLVKGPKVQVWSGVDLTELRGSSGDDDRSGGDGDVSVVGAVVVVTVVVVRCVVDPWEV